MSAARKVSLEQAHARLTGALATLLRLRRLMGDEVSAETAFTIGEAAGVVERARWLPEQDIKAAKE